MKKTKVLLIDDDQDILNASKSRIERNPRCQCRGASDGYEAFSALCENDFDCLLLDIHLLGMNGLAVLERIDHQLALDPTFRDRFLDSKIPVHLISASRLPKKMPHDFTYFEIVDFIPKSKLSQAIAQKFAS